MRIDVYLTQNGYCESRSRAGRLIDEGKVTLDGKVVTKPSETVDESIPHEVVVTEDGLVGRGGLKLKGAIEKFNIDVSGKRCIDVGASTGGFTQCLLACGAKHVVAVDSGRDQLHKSLREDARVTSVEGYNARGLSVEEFGMFELAVMDVSFISQTLIIPALSGVISEGGGFVSLIKPQFEAGRQAIGKNGIVKRASDREYSILRVIDCAGAFGLSLEGIELSPIKGGDGNIEYLAYFIKNNSAKQLSKQTAERIRQLCKE